MNKIKLLMATMLFAATVSAQVQDTPYSMYGYGILGDRATSMQRQMGGVGYAMSSGRQINVMNPASYAAVDSLTFLFDMGADLSFIWSQEGSAKERATGGGLDYLTMQFPLHKHWGGSVGIVPYSSVGYAFGNDVAHGAVENSGSGGINEVYLGFAYEVKGFSIGANVSYAFGNIVNDYFMNPTTGGSAKVERVMRVSDWNLVLGAQYRLPINQTDKLSFGVTYSPKKTLLGTTWVTTQEITQDSEAKRVGELSLKGNYYTPNIFGAGIAFTHDRVSHVNIEFDYSWQGWKGVKYAPIFSTEKPNVMVFDGMNFNNRQRFAIGGEFVPKIRGGYGERIAYRVGGYYTEDYLKIKGNSVREYGVSLGCGFPTPEGKTIVNFGLGWMMRQATPNPMIKENYLNITLGVNFNEVWFFKRKIR